jgi:hypothetical protein
MNVQKDSILWVTMLDFMHTLFTTNYAFQELFDPALNIVYVHSLLCVYSFPHLSLHFEVKWPLAS